MESNHVLSRFNDIMQNLEQADLKEVTELLDYFNGPTVTIDGVQTQPFNDPRIAARLNARYKELTGEDHSNFLVQQERVLDNLLSQEDFFVRNGAYTPMEFTTFRQLKENLDETGPGIEVISGSSNHVLNRFDAIMKNLGQASLEDVSQALDYFNGPPVMIDGVLTHPFNDPMIASRLNARYSEFTGKNHANYLVQQEKVLDNLLSQEDFLKSHGAYSEDDFKTFRTFRENFKNRNSREEVVFEPTVQQTQTLEIPIDDNSKPNNIQEQSSQIAPQDLAQQVRNMLQMNEITTAEFSYQTRLLQQMQQTQDLYQTQPITPTQGMEK